MKGCEGSTLFQVKIYKEDTFSVKMVYKGNADVPAIHCSLAAINISSNFVTCLL